MLRCKALCHCEWDEIACFEFLCPIPARRKFRLHIRVIRVIRGYAFSPRLNGRTCVAFQIFLVLEWRESPCRRIELVEVAEDLAGGREDFGF